MRVLPFPERLPPAVQAELAELEAALDGDAAGPGAERWRELSADVRALAPPPDPGFESALHQRLAASRGAPRRRRPRPAAVIACSAAALLVLAIALPLALGGHGRTPHRAAGVPRRDSTPGFAASAPSVGAQAGGSGAAEPPGAAPGAAPERLQQLAAAIGLATEPAGVQEVSDRAGRLAVAEGGFVQSSRVERQGEAGEATLTLNVPSDRLGRLMAGLARLAPVHSQSQSLQDITGALEAAQRRLAAARQERAALLRALARAQTQGQIESIHARLAQNASAIAAAERAVAGVRRTAARAAVEVTVTGEREAGGDFTLGTGLHDAGRVLTALAGGLAIAVALLAPLALVVWALLAAHRAWIRRRRERALDGGAA
jgi:hypothetical protein